MVDEYDWYGRSPLNLRIKAGLRFRAGGEAARRGESLTVFVERAIEAQLPPPPIIKPRKRADLDAYGRETA